MKLATVQHPAPRNESEARDGLLVVVDSAMQSALPLDNVHFQSMRTVLDSWDEAEPLLQERAHLLETNAVVNPISLADVTFKAPLPRASGFLDGSAYLSHVVRVRKARGAEPPKTLETDPLMYQGEANFVGPHDPTFVTGDETFGIDCEAELAAIVGDVRMGASPEEAARAIRLFTQMNDVSLRGLIPAELAKGFGFIQGKPQSQLGPIAVTPDELEFEGGFPTGRVQVERNDRQIGDLDLSEMHFSFPRLVSHAARTRDLSAGYVIAGGTISNADESAGVACIAEARMIETINNGTPATGFLAVGETIRIKMKAAAARAGTLFGEIITQVRTR